MQKIAFHTAMSVLLAGALSVNDVKACPSVEVVQSGHFSAIRYRSVSIIRTDEGARAAIKQLKAPAAIDISAVDFSSDFLLLITESEKMTSGYSVEIIGVDCVDKLVTIRLNATAPKTTGPVGSRTVVASAMTQPYLIAKIVGGGAYDVKIRYD